MNLSRDYGAYGKKEARVLPELDWIRAIAIVFIIIIHTCDRYAMSGQFSFRWYIILGVEAIARGGLILFFLLSGYLLIRCYKKGEYRSFYLKRASRILPLFILWSAIYYVYSGNSPHPIEFIIKLFQGPIFYHLWYVYTIIGIYLSTPFIADIVLKCEIGVLARFVLISMLVYTLVPSLRFLHVDESLYGYFVPFWLTYFLSGYILKEFLQKQGQNRDILVKSIICYILCITGVFFLSFFKEDFTFPEYAFFDPRPYDSNIFMYAASISLFIILFQIFRFSPPAFIRFLSLRSYGIYLSHAFFLDIYNRSLTLETWYINIAVGIIFVLGCSMLFELFLILIIEFFKKYLRIFA